MWQLESAATKASAGSTAAATESGSGTRWGDDDARTSIPPSNCLQALRVEHHIHPIIAVLNHLNSKNGHWIRNGAALVRAGSQEFVAVWVDMSVLTTEDHQPRIMDSGRSPMFGVV